MPELPEVETVARQLNAVLPGRTIETVEVLREKSARTPVSELTGKTIARVGRRAKMVVVEFEEWEKRLLVHLKMTGQLIFQKKLTSNKEQETGKKRGAGKIDRRRVETRLLKSFSYEDRIVGGHPTADWVSELPSKHTRIVIQFTDGSRLFFNDMRVFGWFKVVGEQSFEAMVGKLPPDVVDDEFTLDYFSGVLKSSNRAIKLVLLDQAKMGGLGNIYVNDALWMAGTKPTRKSSSLKKAEVERLYEASKKVIYRGIELGGASENTYKHINGMGGKYQEEFLVYKRQGLSCLKEGCKGVIEKVTVGARGSYFCPNCQK